MRILAPLLVLPLWAAPPARQVHAYAPPVIPHERHEGAACTDCHGLERSKGIPGIPHQVQGDCRGCHVHQGWPSGSAVPRAGKAAPALKPTGGTGPGPMPMRHATFMRENCRACHGGEPRSRTPNPHPDRPHCLSCHVKD